ncbi:MAG: amidohydrolase [Acidobacteria bacterium]|nr:amidohydrolase [Acidobacteriota bacterium]
MNPDFIAHNANVVTVDSRFSVAQAFAVHNGRFVKIGSNQNVLALAGKTTQMIDLKGRTVMPGFVDGHVHGGARVRDHSAHPLKWPKSIPELLEQIRAVTELAEPEKWLNFGGAWHPSLLAEKRFPTCRELDIVSPRNPIYLPRGAQAAVVNSLALKFAGIDRNTIPPEGVGRIEKDSETGEPTGLLMSNAVHMVRKLLPQVPLGLGAIVQSIVDQNAIFNAAGITSVRDAGHGGVLGVPSPDCIRAFQEVRRRGLLTVRTSLMFEPFSRELPLEKVLEQLRSFGGVTGLGDEWLRIDGLKLYIDGGVESAYLKEPYVTDPSFNGLRNFTVEKLHAIVSEANRLGWSVGVHAVGDAAVQMALDSYEAAHNEKSIKGKRWTLEHAFLLREPQDFERVKRMGVIVSAHIWLMYRTGSQLVEYWGMDRAQQVMPFRTWINQGLQVAGGADCPEMGKNMTNVEFLMLWCEMTRQTEQAGVLGADEKISRQQAIRLHTVAPAYLTFEENLKGSIETGKLADFIIISDDIVNIPEDEIKSLEVLATVVGGRKVYEKSGEKIL